MQLQWEGKIGPAAVISAVGFLGVLVSIGIAWGSLKGDVVASANMAHEAKTAAKEVADTASKRDQRISQQAERLGKIETSVGFIVPALQRIETKIEALANSK